MVERDEEKSIVEQVFSERNLVVSQDIGQMMEDAKKQGTVISETDSGTVRIEGEVTPQKIALAKQFQQIFEESTSEVMDLAAYVPDPNVLKLVKSAGIGEAQVKAMAAAPPWTIFCIDNRNFMKTPDGKLDMVQNYCFRLERAVLDQINVRKQTEAACENVRTLLQERLDNSERQRKELEEALTQKLPKKLGANLKSLGLQNRKMLVTIRQTIKELLLKYLGEENNG